jgi:hypothetical protein
LIKFRVAQLQGGLRLTRRGDLVQEMGHVIGAESAGGKGFLQGRGHLLGAIRAQQGEQFLQLTEERTVGVGQPAQESF